MNAIIAKIYELGYFDTEFSNQFYQAQGYVLLGIILIVVPALICLTYYYLIDSPNLNGLGNWLFCLLVNALLSGSFTAGHAYQIINPISLEGAWKFFLIMGAESFVLSFPLFFILSILLKNWSTNCRKVPF